MALGKYLVQAVPFVYTLQCPTGKVDNDNNKSSIASYRNSGAMQFGLDTYVW